MKHTTVVTASGDVVKVPFPLNPASLVGYEEEPRSVTRCIEAVAFRYGIRVSDLNGSCRRREFARPRQLVYHLARESTGKSLPVIGSIMNRDHTTVMYGIDKHLELMSKSKILRDEYKILLAQVGGPAD